MSFNNSLKSSIKKLRSSQPFNRLATSGTRSALSLVGLKSEFIIKHLHRVGSVESCLPNGEMLRLCSKGDDWVSNQVFWRGWEGYEPETISLFFRLAQKSKVTLDIGAYVGFFTLVAAHANPNGKVFAFEPLSLIYQRLQQNITLNNLLNVETIFGAVGAEEGEATFFHRGEYEIPTNSSLSYEYMKNEPNLVSSQVKIFKLDKFIEEKNIDQVDLMKIDTETTEPDVLCGAKGLLERYRPNIICEVLEKRANEKDLEEMLRPMGYKFYLLTPDGAVERERIEGHSDFLNYLFTHLNQKEISELKNL